MSTHRRAWSRPVRRWDRLLNNDPAPWRKNRGIPGIALRAAAKRPSSRRSSPSRVAICREAEAERPCTVSAKVNLARLGAGYRPLLPREERNPIFDWVGIRIVSSTPLSFGDRALFRSCKFGVPRCSSSAASPAAIADEERGKAPRGERTLTWTNRQRRMHWQCIVDT